MFQNPARFASNHGNFLRSFSAYKGVLSFTSDMRNLHTLSDLRGVSNYGKMPILLSSYFKWSGMG